MRIHLSFWSFASFVLLPLGAILCLALLCGAKRLECVAHKVCGLKLKVGELLVDVPLVVVILCSVWFIIVNQEVTRQKALRATKAVGVDGLQVWRGDLWRHHRNWWLSFATLVVWAVLWRLSALVYQLRLKVDSLEAKRKEVLGGGGGRVSKVSEMSTTEKIELSGEAKGGSEKKKD
eukprot:GHVN01025992.1.p1 GENE.GHVN01025992.1~~GHVN01025992.1.p1  ORF type:complete len:177 (-),score=35.23 GHVN01025992.1:278-808(-)